MNYKNCQYYLPKELGHVETCMIVGMCNKLGKRCLVFKKHTAETRKAIAEAVEIKKKGNNHGN